MPRTADTAILDFPPFQLDNRAAQLRRGDVAIPLRPKTFAVLQLLVSRPGELVTKRDLLDAVWTDVAVTDDVVRLSVRELRIALGDDRAVPRLIETVPRRGYRFLATPAEATRHHVARDADRAVERAADVADQTASPVVGRVRERADVERWFVAAAAGRRQIGFVSGEAGIGKTTLVDAALRDLARSVQRPLVAYGHCVEHYGGGEAYLPIVEALSALRGDGNAARVEDSLREHAPGWLLAAVGVKSEDAGTASTSPDAREHAAAHSLTKLVTTIERLAADTPLVLVLEDVQWSDYSTLDLLSLLAQRREPARLLVLCTLRPADAIAYGHPVASVKREMVRKRLAHEILLGGLAPADVSSYLEARFAGMPLPAALLPLIVDRSEGSPFFMVALVDHLLEQGLLVERDGALDLVGDLETLRSTVSDRLRAIVEPRLERLSADEARVLEAASVAGTEFAAHAIARVAPESSDLADIEVVEQICDGLASRKDVLRTAGTSDWPDGSTSARYAFRHALYQQVVYQGLTGATRRRLHQTIGEGLESAYGEQASEVAGELAVHFEHSRDVERAIRYRRAAAAQATSRAAYREARLHLEAAVEHLRTLPETAENMRREIACLESLGQASFAIDGYGAESGARVYARMRELAERLEGDETRLRVLEGELTVHLLRAEFDAGCARGEELLALAEQLGEQAVVVNAHQMLASQLYSTGQVTRSLEHASRGLALFDPTAPPLPADLGILGNANVAISCAWLGRVGEAPSHATDALARATALENPFQRALATNIISGLWSLLDEHASTRALTEESIRIADEHGFSFLSVTSTMLRAGCDVAEGRAAEGLAAMLAAFDEYAASGQRHNTSYYCGLVARAHLANGDVASAERSIAAGFAFAEETGERVYLAELHRLTGECRAAEATKGSRAGAVTSFEQAITLAATMQSLLLELRATTSLARLVGKAARPRLRAVIERFASGSDCADLRAARLLL